MRRIWFAALILTVVASVNRADDKAPAKADSKPNATKTPAQQFADLEKQWDKEFTKLVKDFEDSKDDERDKIRERAFKMPAEFGTKFMAIADANSKDPVAVKALVWLATVPSSRKLPPPPQAKDALDRLVKNYIDSPYIADLCPMLETAPDGEKPLRQIREKNPSKLVKALAGLCLANLLAENPKPTPAQSAEIESLYAKAIDEASGVKDFPEVRLREAQGALFEIRHLSIGKMVPDFESSDLEGKKVKLSDLKGKVVVLDIWTTWCPPCKAMIPHEREMVKKLEGKPFALVSVSGDDERDNVKKFIEKEPMPWTHWWNGPQGGILEKWNVKFFPTIYVIDAKGTIRHKNLRGKELEDAVESLVKEAETLK